MYVPNNSYKLPDEFKQVFDNYEAGGIHTMKELLALATGVIKAADGKPESHAAIADSLAFYFDDYTRFHEDSDLYMMRYDRLFDPIIDACKNVMEPNGAQPEHVWTKLKWLIEDQAKIIS